MAYVEPSVAVYQRLATQDPFRIARFDSLLPTVVGPVYHTVKFTGAGSSTTKVGTLDYTPSIVMFEALGPILTLPAPDSQSKNTPQFSALNLPVTINDHVLDYHKVMSARDLPLQTYDFEVSSEGWFTAVTVSGTLYAGG